MRPHVPPALRRQLLPADLARLPDWRMPQAPRALAAGQVTRRPPPPQSSRGRRSLQYVAQAADR